MCLVPISGEWVRVGISHVLVVQTSGRHQLLNKLLLSSRGKAWVGKARAVGVRELCSEKSWLPWQTWGSPMEPRQFGVTAGHETRAFSAQGRNLAVQGAPFCWPMQGMAVYLCSQHQSLHLHFS